MPQKDPILNNTQTPLTWTIVVNSVHIVAYKLWYQESNSNEWNVITEGTSTDNIADNGSLAISEKGKFSYWLGIGSTQAQSNFKISIVLSQNGTVIENGLIQENGRVNNDGVARRLEVVTFQ